MNTLCEQFEYSSLKPNLSYHFIKDLDIIIEQIKISNKKCIVEICIECNDLSWNTDKFITVLDYNWLISHGYKYFNERLNGNYFTLFNQLISLFNLQLN
jgi:hypothetical protein